MNYQKVPLPAGLYFLGVPIGAARDITLRALDILASADVLAAEDTRSLRRLMDIHGIPLGDRRIQALHDHSGDAVQNRLIEAVKAGKSVAYASEAGMPLIADPGFELSRAAAEAGILVTCAPGPSAALTALTLAGLPTDAFFFGGFLPNAKAARQTALQNFSAIPGTLVFYESPKRLAAMLRDAAQMLGAERHAVICRELTKKFEEVLRGTLQDLSDMTGERTLKGEIVVLIDRLRSETVNPQDLDSALRQVLQDHTLRDAVDLVARAHDLPRRQVYQAALGIERDDK